MVVLAASIITKTGKPLLSRQFVDMTRIRIEGLLAAFPKLVGSGKQHTYVETENVRYVYQPMESLYLLLVTNKQSNILEDLDTLRMLSKLVPEYCQVTLSSYDQVVLDEELIQKYAFDLLFAFDEVLSFGHKENVTLQQIKTYTEMDSHEEKLHKMIIQSKINDTKDVMRKKAGEIDKSKVDKMREGAAKSLTGGMSSISSGGSMSGFTQEWDGDDRPQEHDGESGGDRFHSAMPSRDDEQGPKVSMAPKKGMVLGKSQRTNQFLEAIKAEGEFVDTSSPRAGSSAPAAAVAAAAVPTDPVIINIEEKVVCTLKKDGGVESLEVQGTMSLEVLEEDSAFLRVQIASGKNQGFQFKTHPNIDKALHSKENILGLKDPNRPFPTGSPLGVLKWRMQTSNEDMVPLSINCWPSVSGGETYVSIEYESTSSFELANVCIAVPVPGLRDPPTVNQIDGDYRYNPRQAVLEWDIELIDDSNRNGSMEFVVPAGDPDQFFPIEVSFSSKSTFCDVKIVSVNNLEGQAVNYSSSTAMNVTNYSVV